MNPDLDDPPVDETVTVLDHVNTLAGARRTCAQHLQSTWRALGAHRADCRDRRDLLRRMQFDIAEIRRLGGEITRLKVVPTRE